MTLTYLKTLYYTLLFYSLE